MIDIYNSIIYISKSIIKTLVASLLIEIFKYVSIFWIFLKMKKFDPPDRNGSV